MLKITSAQFDAFRKVGRPQLIDRIDIWLCVEVDRWNRAEISGRQSIIEEICDVADRSHFEIEMDYAMLCYCVLQVGRQWRYALYSDSWQAILNETTRNASSKVRELFIAVEAPRRS